MRYFLPLLLIVLAGCAPLEHRSDMLPRKKLAELKNKLEIESFYIVPSYDIRIHLSYKFEYTN